MAQTLASLVIRIGADVTGVTHGATQVEKQTRKIQRQFNSIRFSTLAWTGALAGTAVALGRLAESGGEVLNLEGAFLRMTGRQVDALEQLRDATRGLVTDAELMRQTNLALTLGSAGNVDEFARLAETAQKLGRALRVDAAFALESLNTGIARQSRLILDNLGLVVSAETANRRYADALGVAVSALTDAQKQEAFRTEALRQAELKTRELGETTLNTGDAYRQFVTEIKNTTDAMSTGAASSGILGVAYQNLAEIMRGLRGEYRETGELARMWEEERLAAVERLARTDLGIGAFSTGQEQLREQMQARMDEVAAFEAEQQAIRDAAAEYEALTQQIDFLNTMIRDVAVPTINPLTGKLLDFGDATHLLSYEFLPDLSDEIRRTQLEFLVYTTAVDAAEQANQSFANSLSKVGSALGAIGGFAGLFGLQIPFLSNIASGLGGLFSLDRLLPAPVAAVADAAGGTLAPKPLKPNGDTGGIDGLVLNFNVPPAPDPMSAARDQVWQRTIVETFRVAQENGFRA